MHFISTSFSVLCKTNWPVGYENKFNYMKNLIDRCIYSP